MCREVLVPLLVTVWQAKLNQGHLCKPGARTVFRDVVEVVAADDEGSGHLCGDDTASEDTATDGHISSEGALLVWERNRVGELHRI